MSRNNDQLRGKFLTIVIATIIIITFLCVLSGLRIYKMQLALISTGLKSEANRLEKVLSSTFDYSKYLLNHINKQLYHHSDDLEYISKIIKFFKNNEEDTQSIFSSNSFSWINKDLQLVIVNNIGKLNRSIDYSKDIFWHKVVKNPLELQISEPIGEVISGKWVIPVALGIADEQDNFLGAIVMGIDIGLIKEKLNQTINNPSISFTLIDKRTKETILNSSNDKYVSRYFDPSDQIINIDFNIKSSGTLSYYQILNNSKPQSYYQEVANYPYLFVISYDANRITQKLLSVLLPQISIFCAIIFALIVLLYLVHYNILSPIVFLSTFANSITSNKTINQSLNSRQRSYEINNLYNHLLKIESYVTNEKLSNKQLFKTQAELKIALKHTESMNEQIKLINLSLEEKVQERTAELAKALTAKTEFLNNISHEVRTPIQGVTALSSGLIEHWDEFDEEKKIGLATQVAKNAKRLFGLVNNLLDLSKFTANKMIFNIQETDFIFLIKEMIEECETLYFNQNKDIKIDFVNDDQSLLIELDKDRITQVLRNLFANAIKFTDHGTIRVQIKPTLLIIDNQSKKSIKFTISDEGIGIPDDELESIFEPFNQSSRTNTKAGGTGLGLSIVKEIIIGHQGKIWAQNNKLTGASFNFIIPINHGDKINSNPKPKLTINCLPKAIKRSKPANVLIVDDEESCLMSMQMFLYKKDYNLILIDKAKEALEYINDHHNKDIDLILLDLMMPEMDGLEILTKLRTNPDFKVPVILQSGISDDTEINQAYQLGIVDFIKKPYQKVNIISTIEKILNRNL